MTINIQEDVLPHSRREIECVHCHHTEVMYHRRLSLFELEMISNLASCCDYPHYRNKPAINEEEIGFQVTFEPYRTKDTPPPPINTPIEDIEAFFEKRITISGGVPIQVTALQARRWYDHLILSEKKSRDKKHWSKK